MFAVFAAAAIAAFLYYRGSDVGRLPELFGNLGGGPLFGLEGFRDSVVGIVAAGLIGISWFGLGSIVTRFLKTSGRRSKLLEIAFVSAIGAGLWSLIWFFLGLGANYRNGNGTGAGFLSFIWFYIHIIGLYSRPIAVAAVLVGIALAVMGFWKLRGNGEKIDGPDKRSIFENALLVVIAVPPLLALIASLAPPTAKDTLLYHFALPKAFIAQGSNAFIDGNLASYLSLGTEMHTVWAMLLGSVMSSRAAETAAGATLFLFFPLLLMIVYGWSRELGTGRVWSLIATAIVGTVPTAFYVASSGYIDIALAVYITLAIYSAAQWWKTNENAWAIYLAIFLGAALAVKLTALFVFAALALVILLRARDTKDDPGKTGKLLGVGFGALLLACVIASPWYLRTWEATGSPLFPFYMSIWKGEANGWDVGRSNLFQAMNSQYGGDQKTVTDYLLAPVNISVIAQPEDAKYFDGVLGVAFLIGLPIVVWGLWKFDLPVDVKIGTGVAAIMFLFWLFSSQQLRYLMPILPVLALATAAAAETISKGRESLRVVWQYSFVAAAIAGILTTAAWFMQKAPLRVALGGETRERYLTRNLDYYPYYQYLNTETDVHERVWLINTRRDTYNIERPVFSDYLFEDWTLHNLVWDSKNVQELRSKTAAMGVKYVLVRHDFLFDYKQSTLVDDKKPRAENEAKLKMAKELLLDPATTIKSDGKFSLIKVS